MPAGNTVMPSWLEAASSKGTEAVKKSTSPALFSKPKYFEVEGWRKSPSISNTR